MLKSKQLAKALYELSQEKIPDLESKFFDFLKKRNLTSQISSILYHLEKIAEVDREKNSLQIEVAHKINEPTIQAIKKFLQAENLPAVTKTKKELIAGFRAKWHGVIYDASIQTGLKKLKEKIIN